MPLGSPKSSHKPLGGAHEHRCRTAKPSTFSRPIADGAAERLRFLSRDFERAMIRCRMFWGSHAMPAMVSLALLAAGLCPAGAAEESACSCDGTPQFPEAASLLETLGYDPGEFTVLFAWNEIARDGSGALISGFRLRPASGAPVDVYVDDAFQPLDAAALAGLNIPEKNWNLSPLDVESETPSDPKSTASPRPTPATVRYAASPADSIEFPALDLAQIEAEDRESELRLPKSPRRTGVFRDLPDPIQVDGWAATDGAWQTMADGARLWALEITSPEATGLRIHFAEERIPESARILVYDPAQPKHAYALRATGSGDEWSPTCFTETIVVECFVPAGSSPTQVHLEIDRLVHMYVELASLPWAKATAGTCNLDVTCYSAWSDVALSVGGIGTIGSDGSLWCTGTLIADRDPNTAIPYFLTANHCVRGQSTASSIEVYWLYQTSSCDSAAPDPAGVPRTTGGADYLVGATKDSGSDFTLLRLNNTPPSDIPFAGWSTQLPEASLAVAAIHHPRGDFKRICFGTVQGYDDHLTEILWYDGTTEPASSGCPLFLQTSQKIIGQLWGGTASCETPDEPDFFGRFDQTYPLVAEYLDPNGEACQKPSTPTGVTATDGTLSGSVQVSWTAATGATQYQVWRGLSSLENEATALSDWLTTTTYTDYTAGTSSSKDDALGCAEEEEVTPTTYYYFVKSANDCGESALSTPDAGYAATVSKVLRAGFPAAAWLAAGLLLIGLVRRRARLFR